MLRYFFHMYSMGKAYSSSYKGNQKDYFVIFLLLEIPGHFFKLTYTGVHLNIISIIELNNTIDHIVSIMWSKNTK